jgi:solute:Na+ symporter, SSS family
MGDQTAQPSVPPPYPATRSDSNPVLGPIALLGAVALAAKVKPLTSGGAGSTNTIVPGLFEQVFPHWFAGIAFATVINGALVPSAVKSIAAANLFTRNIYKEYLRRDASPREEATVSEGVAVA